MKHSIAAVTMTLFLSSSLFALSWAPSGEPKMVADNNQLSVTFAVTESTDVEVAIVDTIIGKIVRHLAAGKLGSNPPAPLAPNSLSQSLIWDKLDDFGNTVDNAALCVVRVRAGMDVALDNILRPKDLCRFAENPMATTTLANINGSLYAFGTLTGRGGHNASYGIYSQHTIRRFAVEADSLRYVKTIFPAPAGLAPSDISPLGIIQRDDGTYSPKMHLITALAWGGKTLMSVFSTILPFGVSGSIMVTQSLGLNGPTLPIDTNGAPGLSFNMLTSPVMPDLDGDRVGDCGGMPFYSPSPDSQYYYLSGVYSSLDTGFWHDGGVFKINRLTGVATRWLSMDPVPNAISDSLRQANVQWINPSVMGTCADHQGRVFVCDRLHRRIGVYDTAANLIDTMAIPYPELVIVDEPTNSIYVLTANFTGGSAGPLYILKKFKNWPANRAQVWTKALPDFGYITTMEMHPSIVVIPNNGKNLIAIAVHNILLYRDDDTALTLVKNYGVNRETTPDNFVFDRPLFVDRSKEVTYFSNGATRLFKTTDWDEPTAIACTTSSGQRLLALDACISPDNRSLFVVQPPNESNFYGPLMRYTTDTRPAPINYPNVDTNMLRPNIVGRLGSGIVMGGLGVHPRDNRVALVPDITWTVGYPTYEPGGVIGGLYDVTKLFMYADSGSRIGQNGEFADTMLKIGSGNGILASPRFDLQGNLYVGAAVFNSTGRPTPFLKHTPPTGYENDFCYQYGKTVIARIPAGARATIDVNTAGTDLTVTNNGLLYGNALMMQSGEFTGFCCCRSGSFDVDYYGRLFVPNAVSGQVTILDNNDNVIKTFGQYGNVDSWGPGSPVPQPDIPMHSPVAAAASDNYVYVADELNMRLTRVKMAYELNNMPGFDGTMGVAGIAGAVREPPLRITATPNPSYAATRISFVLGQRTPVRLAVYTLDGKLVRTIANGWQNAGKQAYAWNGHDAQGKASSTGVYLVRLTTGNKVITTRIILAK